MYFCLSDDKIKNGGQDLQDYEPFQSSVYLEWTKWGFAV